MGLVDKVRHSAELVKFSHSVFALPFALASTLTAAGGFPGWALFGWIVAAMVTARNAAMAFNRLVDASIDAKNPRTAGRPLPSGLLSRKYVLIFFVVNALLFIGVTWRINPLCFRLSWIALIIVCFYSLTKRFTSFSHIVLGVALGISPVGAWIAVTGTFALMPFLLSCAVLFWVAGFDMIYATQDAEFDRKEGLHSMVVRFGIKKALRLARWFHVVCLALLVLWGWKAGLDSIYFGFLTPVAGLLAYQHSLVGPKDLSRVNLAFFNVNGLISLIFLAGVLISFASL